MTKAEQKAADALLDALVKATGSSGFDAEYYARAYCKLIEAAVLRSQSLA